MYWVVYKFLRLFVCIYWLYNYVEHPYVYKKMDSPGCHVNGCIQYQALDSSWPEKQVVSNDGPC